MAFLPLQRRAELDVRIQQLDADEFTVVAEVEGGDDLAVLVVYSQGAGSVARALVGDTWAEIGRCRHTKRWLPDSAVCLCGFDSTVATDQPRSTVSGKDTSARRSEPTNSARLPTPKVSYRLRMRRYIDRSER